MEDLTLESLPRAFNVLYNDVSEIKRLLTEKYNSSITEQWFDLIELCSYLPDKPAKATVYGWVQSNSIPFHKGSKKLRFLKSEIDSWLINGMPKNPEPDFSEKLLPKKRKGGKS